MKRNRSSKHPVCEYCGAELQVQKIIKINAIKTIMWKHPKEGAEECNKKSLDDFNVKLKTF